MSAPINISTIFDGLDEEIAAARQAGKPSERQKLVDRCTSGIDVSTIFDGLDEEIATARQAGKPSKRRGREER